MNAEPPIGENHEYDEVSGLLPWYVNGTLRDADRQRVDAHLQDCARCREDLRLEARIHAELSTDAAVAYMPSASLKRLNARLDALPSGGIAPASLRTAPPDRWWVARRYSIAASVAALCLTLGLAAAEQWRESHARAAYYTVTTPAAPVPNAVIRAVFSPQMSVSELQGILDEAQLHIVGGPSDAGVYSLAPTSERNPAEAMALLRAHPTVRFAELTRPGQRPPAYP
jgi:anti-sigma factor RsiW